MPPEGDFPLVGERSRARRHHRETRTHPLDLDFLTDYLNLFLLPHCEVLSSERVYQKALQIQHETQYRFFESLIIAATLESGASILYRAVLQHDSIIGHLRITNHFLATPLQNPAHASASTGTGGTNRRR
jgi:hypothetical protein